MIERIVEALSINSSKKENNTFWIKVSQEEYNTLIKDYPIVEKRTMPKTGVVLSVVRILNNNIVLDIR